MLSSFVFLSKDSAVGNWGWVLLNTDFFFSSSSVFLKVQNLSRRQIMEFALFCNRNKTIPNLAKQQLGELINTLMPYFVPLFFSRSQQEKED